MVYAVKTGLVATASLAGTAFTTLKMSGTGGGIPHAQGAHGGRGAQGVQGHSMFGASKFSSSSATKPGASGTPFGGRPSKADDTMHQMHMWK